MSQISTISEFLLHAGTEYRVFDMGRGIRKISSQKFLELENGQHPAPYPRQQHAWFGLVFWNRQMSGQHYIWFIRLPIDEQGVIMPAARNHFLQIIVDALGQQLEHTEQRNGQLPENPYTFVPQQQQLADFNSISRQALKLGHSEHFDAALRYLQAPKTENWQQVPLQGLADFASVIQQQANEKILLEHFFALTEPVRHAVLISLENQALNVKLSEMLLSYMQQGQDSSTILVHALRGLCQSQAKGLVEQAVDLALNNASGDILTIIAARNWQTLQDPQRLRKYLEILASNHPPELFSGLYRDLVQLPDLRTFMLASLRWPDKSPALTRAVGNLFSQKEQ